MSEAVYMMFSPQSWDSQHSRTRALAIEMSKLGCHTIYVDPPNSVAAIVRESVSVLVNPLRRENVVSPHDFRLLEVWTPPTLPTFYRGSLTPGFDRRLFKTWFEKRMSKIKKPIIAIIAMPYWWDGYLNDYAQKFSALLFDYQDTIGTYARTAAIRQHMSEILRRLVSQVDGVITHTEANYKNMLAHPKPPKVCLIRNAGNGVSSRRQNISARKVLLGHPVIGTVGRISQNVDVTLLLELADRFTTGSIVNIGTVTVPARALKAKKNIVLKPPMLQDELQLNIQSFDVGILPYQQNIEGSPMRVYDLLSGLLQVVSTKFPDSEYFADVVHIASNHVEFITTVSEILSDKKSWITEGAIEKFVQNNTWNLRAEKLVLFCETFLGSSSTNHMDALTQLKP